MLASHQWFSFTCAVGLEEGAICWMQLNHWVVSMVLTSWDWPLIPLLKYIRSFKRGLHLVNMVTCLTLCVDAGCCDSSKRSVWLVVLGPLHVEQFQRHDTDLSMFPMESRPGRCEVGQIPGSLLLIVRSKRFCQCRLAVLFFSFVLDSWGRLPLEAAGWVLSTPRTGAGNRTVPFSTLRK